MPLKKKTVSFGDASSNTVHIVENYGLAKTASPDKYNEVWYKPNEVVKLTREDRIYREQQNTALAYRAVAASAAYKAARLSKHRGKPGSQTPFISTELPYSTKKELFEQKAQALRELRLVASAKDKKCMTHHKEQKEHSNRGKRATREALAATALPSRRDRCRRRYYQIHTNGKNIGRVQAVFYSY